MEREKFIPPLEAWKLSSQVQKLTGVELMQAFAKVSGKWCVFLSIDPLAGEISEACLAAPYLAPDRDGQLIEDGYGVIVCETREEMERVFNLTIGDSGATLANPYCGDLKIYALSCDPDGILLQDNT
jgi:hypothetical protein